MKELKHIRNRIHGRHSDRSYHARRSSTNQSPGRFYRFIVACMTLMVLALGGLTFSKTPLYIDLSTKLGAIMPDLPKLPALPSWVSTSFLTKLIPFEGWFKDNKEQPVSATNLYEPGTKTGYFVNEDNEAISLYDGLVVYVGEEKDASWIVVHHDNGLYATYGNLSEVYVKIYDRIVASAIIGSFPYEIQLEFLYQNEDISYEQAMALEED